ncbi:MAG: hypothetical protein ACRER2_01840 [Methylococcales bacterium]
MQGKPFKGTALDYLQTSFCPNDPPETWQQHWDFFKFAVLNLDRGFAGFLNWFEARVAGEPIDIELLRRQALIPEEILIQNAFLVNAYLNNLSRAEKTLNRVRVIFMGHGNAGKTSLVRCLHREEVIEEKEAMTPGIEIREWNLPDSEIRAG